LAAVSISVGHVTAHKLVKLKNAFASEAAVKQHYANMPSEVAEELDPEEFDRFCQGVGLRLGVGLDGAVGLIDADQNGSVSMTEFTDWWLMDL